MQAAAVLFDKPRAVALGSVALHEPRADDVVIAVEWSGISAGTERLLWSGEMPPFPGFGYPLVPGYEAVGCIVAAGESHEHRIGETVFVPGAQCFTAVRGLFGGAASQLVVPASRAKAIAGSTRPESILFALAATAQHALQGSAAPELIVGHGTLGRLLARLVMASGAPAPVVWEHRAARRYGASGYAVVDPADDDRRDYRVIVDASGDPAILDGLVPRLVRGGEIVLAGFYKAPLSFAFPPAFMREMRLRVAAEWQDTDLDAVRRLVAEGRLSFDGLVSHTMPARDASAAYAAAFDDAACLKMVIDWKGLS